MRRWLIATMLLLLFVACHHGDKQQPSQDSTPAVPPPVVADTVPTPAADTVVPVVRPKVYITHEDSIERTNLRLFTRKKQRTIYSPALIVGEWLRETKHMTITPDGKGGLWDTGDDIRREEAQPFSWTMDSNLLTFEHHLTLGAVVMRMYVVTFVDDETLVYRNAYGESYMWEKAPVGYTDLPPQSEGRTD